VTQLYQNMGIRRISNLNRRQPMKSGIIYIAHNSRDGKNTFKVGKTQRSPEERMKELTSETSNLGEYIVKSYFPVEDMDVAERVCHKRLSIYRIQRNREFFELPFPELFQIVKKTIKPFLAIDYVPESEMDNTAYSFDNSFDTNSYKDQFPQPEYKPNECLTSNDEIISQGIFKCFYCDTKNRIDSFNENKIPVCSACKIKPFDKERFKFLCRLYGENQELKNKCLSAAEYNEIISKGIFKCFNCGTKNRIDSFDENKVPVCSSCKVKPFDKERFKFLCRMHGESKTLKIVTAWVKFCRSEDKIAYVVSEIFGMSAVGITAVGVILILIFELIVGF
jgi:hypothetical protein